MTEGVRYRQGVQEYSEVVGGTKTGGCDSSSDIYNISNSSSIYIEVCVCVCVCVCKLFGSVVCWGGGGSTPSHLYRPAPNLHH